MIKSKITERLKEIQRLVFEAIRLQRESEVCQASATFEMAKLCADAGLSPGYIFDLWGDGEPKRADKTTDIPPVTSTPTGS